MSIYPAMSMGERILFIRENCGDLSQEEFAKRLGMTKSAISGYETERRVPTESVLKHIAREFRVDEDWLMHGNGEPFEPDDDDILEEVFCHCNCSEFERAFLKEYLFLPEHERLEFSAYLERLFRNTATALGFENQSTGVTPTPQPPHEMSREEMHAEVDRQLDEEKGAAENALGFGHGKSGTATG
jgi:transcriptional regulator with XRE-family HTH domain